MNDVPLATPRRVCLSRPNSAPLATHRRECLWESVSLGSKYYVSPPIGNHSARVPLEAEMAVHSDKRRPIGDSPARVHLGKFFFRQQVLCMTSHWQPLGESASRGRKVGSYRKMASHWQLPSESASALVTTR